MFKSILKAGLQSIAALNAGSVVLFAASQVATAGVSLPLVLTVAFGFGSIAVAYSIAAAVVDLLPGRAV